MDRSSIQNDERMYAVEENYKRITEDIARAAERSGRQPQDIELVAVTKTVPVEIVDRAIELGVRHIGENRVQELYSKYDSLIMRDELCVSVIGHLQSNKVKRALQMADMIQSVDSVHIAQAISEQAIALGRRIPCLAEINIGGEESKTGAPLEIAEELVAQMGEMGGLEVVGLMTIPPISANPDETRRYFEKIHKLFIDIGSKNPHNNNVRMKYLSMGMSSDYIEAIEEGSNMVRIGSALFGARNKEVK